MITKKEYIEKIKQVMKSDFMVVVNDKQINAIANKIADYSQSSFIISKVIGIYFSEVLRVNPKDIAYNHNISDLEIPYSILHEVPFDE